MWYEFVKKTIAPYAVVALVGNMLDLVQGENPRKTLTPEERVWGQEFAKSNNMLYCEVSAKTGENIEYCLFKIFSRITHYHNALGGDYETEKSTPVSISGYVFKVPGSRGNKIGGWQERFFVCNTNDEKNVYYYRNNEDYRRKKFAGKISLTDVTSVEKGDAITNKPNSLIVSTPKRTWYFYAEQEVEIGKWYDLFYSYRSKNKT